MKDLGASKIVITCNKRLAPYLEQEIVDLGFTPTRKFSTGVEIKGTISDCIRLNLHVRCASQVLFSVRQFKATSPESVYESVVRYPWEDIIDANGYFSVTSTVDHFTVNNPLFVNVKVKDAIVDRMRRETGRRPDSGPEQDRLVIHLYWKDEDAEIFVDTSGETLAKHGYRKIPGKAPMLEALATGTVLATKWDRKSPFVNPMCGSGTVAIEAALIATRRAPGLLRKNYAFMHIKDFDRSLYDVEYKRLHGEIVLVPELEIIASDRSEDAIQISKVNAALAGVENQIRFEQYDFEKTTIPQNPGVVFLNPEYGERLGDLTELETTYEHIGDFLKQKCQGYTGYIFTGNLDLAKKIGLKASRRIEFFTSKIDCRLLEYELYGGSRRAPKESREAT